MRIGRWTTKQKVLVGAAAAALVAAALIVVWAGDDDPEFVAGPDTTLEHETTTTSTTIPTTTSTMATSETTTAPPTTAPRGSVPGQPTDVQARPGGGSMEVSVRWGPVAGATGYRILRCDSPTGRYVVTADIDVTTGATTKAADVATIWSANHTYRPGGPGLTTPDTSPWFEYIDIGDDPRWFTLVAYNPAGAGPASAVVWSVSGSEVNRSGTSAPTTPVTPPTTAPPAPPAPGQVEAPPSAVVSAGAP